MQAEGSSQGTANQDTGSEAPAATGADYSHILSMLVNQRAALDQTISELGGNNATVVFSTGGPF